MDRVARLCYRVFLQSDTNDSAQFNYKSDIVDQLDYVAHIAMVARQLRDKQDMKLEQRRRIQGVKVAKSRPLPQKMVEEGLSNRWAKKNTPVAMAFLEAPVYVMLALATITKNEHEALRHHFAINQNRPEDDEEEEPPLRLETFASWGQVPFSLL